MHGRHVGLVGHKAEKLRGNFMNMKYIVPLTLLTILLSGCGKQVSDPLLPAGEQAIVGFYKLDNVLLGAGGLVRLHPLDPMFDGVGDTLEQAAKKGLFTSGQVAILQQLDCAMQVVADHTFTISNLPAADFSRTISMKGSWSLKVYHVFETYGYRISMKGGPKGDLVLVKFLNADRPDTHGIEVYYNEGQMGQVAFRFTKINRPSLSQPTR
jgi:hypothetical protein